MQRKFFVICIVLVVVCAMVGFTACDKNNQPTPQPELYYMILGDSIAEGLAGPSPLIEKENYAYPSLVGRGNGFVYMNASVSGHKSAQLYNVLRNMRKNGDTGAEMRYSFLKKADIIQVSILGNDLLQQNLGKMLVDFVNYKKGNEADFNYVFEILESSRANLTKIMSIIKEMNPTAQLVLQTIYNPVFDSSALISSDPVKDADGNVMYDGKSMRTILTELGISHTQYRSIGAELIEFLNEIIRDYVKDNSDVALVEVYGEFNKLYDNDTTAGKAYARRLFSQDYIHPSNEGHAVIAELTQAKLIELGYGSDSAFVSKLKEIRIDQLERMYSYEGSGVDVETVKNNIANANSARDVDNIYFNAVTRDSFFTEIEGRDPSIPKTFYPWIMPNYANNI